MHFADEIGPQLTLRFLQDVLDQYGQGQIVSWNPFTGGWTNINNYLKTSSGEFILRIYKYGVRTHQGIGLEIEVINHLNQKGLPVARAFKNKSGNYITKARLGGKELDVALFSFVPGEAHPHPTSVELQEIGLALAKLHLGLADFTARHTKKYFRLKFETLRLAKKISSRLKENWSYPKVTTLEELRSLWRTDREYLLALDRRFGSNLRAVSIIHGDFHPGNIKFEGGKISGIFDFDNLMHAPRLLDLALCLAQFKYWHADLPRDTLSEALKPILEGYGSQIGISSADKRLIISLTSFCLWKQVAWTLKKPLSNDQHSHQEYFLGASLSGIKELQVLRLKGDQALPYPARTF